MRIPAEGSEAREGMMPAGSPAACVNGLVLVIVGVGLLWLTPLWLPTLINIILQAAPPLIYLWLVVIVLKWMIRKVFE
jgi:hypothetical protein